MARLSLPLRFADAKTAETPIMDRFCDSDTCQLTAQTTVPAVCEVQTATGTSAITDVQPSALSPDAPKTL
jgi:hypothetical protein